LKWSIKPMLDTQQRLAAGHLNTLRNNNSGNCPMARGVIHGYRTSVAHNPSTLGALAFLFQLRVSSSSHRQGKGHHAPGIA
jgi:hypothetical protein